MKNKKLDFIEKAGFIMLSKHVIATVGLLTCCILLSIGAKAGMPDTSEIRKMGYYAFLNRNSDLCLSIVDKYKPVANTEQGLCKLVEAYNGLFTAFISNKDKEGFEKYIESSDNAVKALKKFNDNNAYYLALEVSINGMKLGFFPSKGMTLGPVNQKLIKKALKINPNETLAVLQQANGYFHTPSMFGGDKELAIEYYNKAIGLYESTGDTIYNYHYLEALAWLGIAYSVENKPEDALRTYKKAIGSEPLFMWIKYSLLPDLKKKYPQIQQ